MSACWASKKDSREEFPGPESQEDTLPASVPLLPACHLLLQEAIPASQGGGARRGRALCLLRPCLSLVLWPSGLPPIHLARDISPLSQPDGAPPGQGQGQLQCLVPSAGGRRPRFAEGSGEMVRPCPEPKGLVKWRGEETFSLEVTVRVLALAALS